MRNVIFILLFLISGKLFSQIDSTVVNRFEKLQYSTEYLNLNYDSIYLSEDSTHITFKYNRKLITTETYFKINEKKLTVNYYFIRDSLFFITTSEICPTKPELTLDSRYFIYENKIAQQDHSSRRPVSLGIVRSLKDLKEEHFCPDSFSYDFLEKYIWILLRKIREKYRE